VGRACSTNGGEEECIWDVGEKARRKRPLGRPRRRLVGWGGMDRIDLSQDME
jgi:hypothetical protein